MKPKTSGDTARLAAQVELAHRRIRASVKAKVVELSENGLTDHEVAAHLTLPVHVVRLIVRSGAARV